MTEMTWLSNRRKQVPLVNEVCPDEPYTETPVITISSERQTCKTEMIIDRMVGHAREGLRVVYVSQTLKHSYHTFQRIEYRAEPDVSRIRRTNGAAAIEFTSGGVIRFLSAGSNTPLGLSFDILVWDDVDRPIPNEWMCALAASPGPLAYRLVAA